MDDSNASASLPAPRPKERGCPDGEARLARAVWLQRARQVELVDEPLPALEPGRVRVRAVVSALSHGTEMLVYRGQVPPDLELDLPTFRGSFRFPIKYGYASVGRVEEVGEGVENLRVGDLVFAHHPHQTEYVVPVTLPVLLPPTLEEERGVFFANLETAVNVALDAQPRLGERVLIFGQGVIGLLLTQLLRRMALGCIITVDPLEQRRDLSAAVGANAVLPTAGDLPERVRDLTDGLGADLAIEASGSPGALAAAIDCVTFGGTIVVCSWYGTKEVALPLGGAFHRRRLRIVSSQVGSVDPGLQPRWSRSRRAGVARDLLTDLELPRLITHRFPFERAAEAYALVDERPEEVVQVLLRYDGV